MVRLHNISVYSLGKAYKQFQHRMKNEQFLEKVGSLPSGIICGDAVYSVHRILQAGHTRVSETRVGGSIISFADASVRSAQKVFIHVIKDNVYRIRVSQKNFIQV